MASVITLGRRLPAIRGPALSGPDWAQARAHWIERCVAASQARSTGGWFVLDASRRVGRAARCYVVAGEPLVTFRDRGGRVIAGPDRCPHFGARLSEGRIEGDAVVCPWHGLALGALPRGGWRPLPTHDDGVLVWVRLDEAGAQPSPLPPRSARPSSFLAGVVRAEVRCDPIDVIANRFDPWHGTHLHPYAFSRLAVVEVGAEHVTVRVARRIAGPIAIEVDARFESPAPRTIVMTIVAGEGAGSVVETHATPIEPGRTAVIEASLAASDRPSFRLVRPLASLVRALLERSARRLWVDDGRYAERLYELRGRDRGGRRMPRPASRAETEPPPR